MTMYTDYKDVFGAFPDVVPVPLEQAAKEYQNAVQKVLMARSNKRAILKRTTVLQASDEVARAEDELATKQHQLNISAHYAYVK